MNYFRIGNKELQRHEQKESNESSYTKKNRNGNSKKDNAGGYERFRFL
jgi:hypothetical protein